MSRRQNLPPEEQPTGSPGEGEPVFLVVGKFGRTHGIKGEIILHVITDFPERLKKGVRVFAGENRQPVRISEVRPYKKGLLLSLQGFDSVEAVEELRNQFLFVRSDEIPPLPEGEYYHHQLIGMQVFDEENRELGTLVQILDTTANDVYIVRSDAGREILLPATEEVLLDIDPASKKIRVHILPGLLGEESQPDAPEEPSLENHPGST